MAEALADDLHRHAGTDEQRRDLTDDQQESLTDRVDLLAERGPDLGRPVVDRIQTSRHHNMKELRAAQGGAAAQGG